MTPIQSLVQSAYSTAEDGYDSAWHKTATSSLRVLTLMAEAHASALSKLHLDETAFRPKTKDAAG